MAKMYVCNIKSNETVNLRKTPGGTVLVRVGYGKEVDAYESSTEGWHHASYNGYDGYIMSQYLSTSDPNNASGETGNNDEYTIEVIVDTNKHGVGGTLNLRESADKDSRVVAKIPNGSTIHVKSTSGTWLAAKYNNNVGYVMAEFIVGTEAYGGSSSGGSSSNENLPLEFTDIVESPFVSTKSYDFVSTKAVEYAIAHSTSNTSGADPKRNRSFGSSSSNDCANFVNQCLCAGGAPMFDGWCYGIENIPNSWDTTPWIYTNQSRRAMLERGWIKRITPEEVVAGDIIYTYLPKYKEAGKPTPYDHVTIAVSDYDANRKGCLVCGHSINQNREFKSLEKTATKEAYCYHVESDLAGNGSEKLVDMSDGNSHAL